MARPIYETNDDIKEKRRLAAVFTAHTKHPAYERDDRRTGGPDFIVEDRSFVPALILGWLECKGRRPNYSYEILDHKGGYMLSMIKWQAAKELLIANRWSKFWLCIGLTDGDWLMTAFPSDPVWSSPQRKGGRHDRNDAADIEPCVYIPMHQFERIGDPP